MVFADASAVCSTSERYEETVEQAPSAVLRTGHARGPATAGDVRPLSRDNEAPPHFHGQLEIVILRRGTLTLLAGRRSIPLCAGQVAWILPGVAHTLQDVSDDAVGFIVEVQPWTAARAVGHEAAPDDPYRGWFDRLSRTLAGHVAAAPDASALDDLESLARLCAEAPITAVGVLLEAFVARALAASASHPLATSSLGLAFWVPALLAAEPDLDRSKLARRIGVSEAYLTRLMGRQLGVSFEAQRNRTRLISLLAILEGARHGGRRISLLDAAFAAGFGSYSQMHRIFVEAVGFAPTEFLVSPSRAGESVPSSRRGAATSRRPSRRPPTVGRASIAVAMSAAG